MSYNRCEDTHKFGIKYLPSVYKTQFNFRSHFSGKKVRLVIREIRYLMQCAVAFGSLLFLVKAYSLGLCLQDIFIPCVIQSLDLVFHNFVFKWKTSLGNV